MLYICPTPIGNLEDVTLRVLSVLGRVDVIACEDTRRTRILLARHGIDAGRLLSFHEHNEEQRARALLPLLREGKEVAVVSDAGMPGLSDPGFGLIRACAAEGIPVTVLPGPSSVSTAVVASALPTDRFAFVGFLARGRTKLIAQLRAFDGTGASLVAFESPHRLRVTLGIIANVWPHRRLAVCRELTKLHEEVIRGTAEEVLGRLADPVRGEIVIVMEPAAVSVDTAAAGRTARGMEPVVGGLEVRATEAMAELGELGIGTKKAASIVAALTGLSSRRAYRLALEAKPGKKADREG